LKVKYFYQNNKSKVHEVMIDSLATALSELIELPDTIEVCLYKLDENVYGGIDKYTPNRLGLNSNLTLEDIPKILVHEPYHNTETEISYEEYRNTPWEVDVQNRVDKLLTEVLNKLI
jgi:hypothetical protein